MGSIYEVRSTGLGGATREIKRHSKVKVPKVSHKLSKVKRKWKSHKPKEIDLRPKKKHEKKITQKHEKMKVKVIKYDKYGDRIN